MHKKRTIFIQGPILPEFIAQSIANHRAKTEIGAHEIFLGQVRSDEIDGKKVRAIEFSSYTDMADDKAADIREDAFSKFDLGCLHIHHSLGEINAGEICFFVFVSSAHRQPCREALAYIVERIKHELPVFGKEIFQDASHQWKSND